MESEPLFESLQEYWSGYHIIFAVVPNAGVPPAEVLQKLVPGESLAVLEEWTAQNYSAKKTELRDLKDTRTKGQYSYEVPNILEFLTPPVHISH